MPNHVMNIVTFENCSEERLAEILQAIRGETRAIDFEKILPRPENIFRGDLGQKEYELYGENNWYDWSVKNWGTKWNAYETDVCGNTIRFKTAWSEPQQIMEELGRMFPDVRIVHEWANEDIGSNCGKQIIEDNSIEDEFCVDGWFYHSEEIEKEAMEFAKRVWGIEE